MDILLEQYLATKSPREAGQIYKALMRLVRLDGAVGTRYGFILHWYESNSLELHTFEEYKIKEMSDRAYFRATQQQQDAYERRRIAAGMRTIYLINDWDMGKMPYDFACWLSQHAETQTTAIAA